MVMSHYITLTRGILHYSIRFYFTTKRLHEQYRVSSGQNRWLYCPLVPEGIIKLGVMPAGMKNAILAQT